ncbi:hypothetical protein D3C80_1646640 [compost metagenome]
MGKIRIHQDMTREIAEELNTTRQNVYAALSYYNNSDLAEKIRLKAKEKLIEEAGKITVTEIDADKK